MTIKQVVKARYDKQTKVNKQISDLLLSDHELFLSKNALQLADLCNTSNASIIRFCKSFGYNGLNDFKIDLAKQISQEDLEVEDFIMPDDDLKTICERTYNLIDDGNKQLFQKLDYHKLNKAINILNKAKKVYILGIGASGLPAYDLYHKLNRININAVYTFDAHMEVEFINYSSEEDVVIAFSYSGHTKEVLYPVSVAKERGAKIITVTRDMKNPLSKLADVDLYVPGNENTARVAAMSSVVSSITIESLLYLGIIRKNYNDTYDGLNRTRELVKVMKVGQDDKFK